LKIQKKQVGRQKQLKIKKMNKKEFTAYLESKELAKSTQKIYLLNVQIFFNWIKKEDLQVTKHDVLKYLEYLKNNTQQKNATRQNHLIALNHYFTFLYENEHIMQNPCSLLKIRGTVKKKLHKIYTSEELDTLFDSYYQLFVRNFDDSTLPKFSQKQTALCRERNALALSILTNQGTTTTEIEKIELDDVDLIKATLKIRGSKKHNERTLPLKATQIGLFINYLQNIRPQMLEYHATEPNKLFLPLAKDSKKGIDHKTMSYSFNVLIKQLKTIDKQFINIHQLRTSIITFWIKNNGLRKAQYFAGHQRISSTEKYISNDLENLIDDINKLHPF
jgi:site-specific recombinase XerD